jgi:Rps23 Pro-64 3,4-dihydroxylase Tpa1-like proline 4-hydroxylase
VQEFLTPDSATMLLAGLADTDWRTVLNRGERHYDLNALQLAALDPAAKAQLAAAVAEGGAFGFQYLYDNFPLHDAAAAGDPLTPVQRALHELLSGAPFLDLMRAISGAQEIAFADSQLTRYRPGHFLTRHDDDVSGKGRLYAYVLGMTMDWRADWGGVLCFLDRSGDIAEGFTPAFNSLALFSVPQAHAVSMVTPLAPRPRYAATGWLRR